MASAQTLTRRSILKVCSVRPSVVSDGVDLAPIGLRGERGSRISLLKQIAREQELPTPEASVPVPGSGDGVPSERVHPHHLLPALTTLVVPQKTEREHEKPSSSRNEQPDQDLAQWPSDPAPEPTFNDNRSGGDTSEGRLKDRKLPAMGAGIPGLAIGGVDRKSDPSGERL